MIEIRCIDVSVHDACKTSYEGNACSTAGGSLLSQGSGRFFKDSTLNASIGVSFGLLNQIRFWNDARTSCEGTTSLTLLHKKRVAIIPRKSTGHCCLMSCACRSLQYLLRSVDPFQRKGDI